MDLILYNPSVREEHSLRVDYVNSEGFSYQDFNGYRNFVIKNIPGVVETGYRGGDDPNTIESLVFESESHLAWFKLRYS